MLPQARALTERVRKKETALLKPKFLPCKPLAYAGLHPAGQRFSFWTYLLAQQERQDMVGDFARAVIRDNCIPLGRRFTHRTLSRYVLNFAELYAGGREGEIYKHLHAVLDIMKLEYTDQHAHEVYARRLNEYGEDKNMVDERGVNKYLE